MSSVPNHHPARAALPCALALALAACGPASRRDLSTIPQRQITFDDLCQLQDYFDQRNATQAPPFRAIDEQSTESQATEPDERGHLQRLQVGEGTYVVSDRAARRRLHRLLDEEYTRLPVMHLGRHDGDVQIHVAWWASGQMRRLRPDRTIALTSAGETVELPFNPCVGEFLFGAPVYALRRHVLESDRVRAHGELPPEGTPEQDAGATPEADAGAALVPLDGGGALLVDAAAQTGAIGPFGDAALAPPTPLGADR